MKSRSRPHVVTPEDLAFWRGLIRLAERAARGGVAQPAPGLARQGRRASRIPAPGPEVQGNPFFVLGQTVRRYADAGASERAAIQGDLAAAARRADTALTALEEPAERRERKDIDG